MRVTKEKTAESEIFTKVFDHVPTVKRKSPLEARVNVISAFWPMVTSTFFSITFLYPISDLLLVKMLFSISTEVDSIQNNNLHEGKNIL